MARTRSIKPGFFDNDVLGSMKPLARLLFIGLWCQADRAGRLEDRPKKLKKTILGYDDITTDDVDKMLEELQENGFIIRYQANSMDYIQVINFEKHQNPHKKEKESEIPPPYGSEPEPQSKNQAARDSDISQDADEKEPCAEPEDGQASGESQKQSTLERRFELFWAAYPKKKAKKTAFNAFKRLNPDENLFNRIMEAIGRARTSKEWLKDGGQFIPHPSTWLNGGCWEDEITDGGIADGSDRECAVPTDERTDGRPSNQATGPGIQGFKPADV